MRTILFTKKDLDKKLISTKLVSKFSIHYSEVLKIETVKISPFDLKGKSLIFTSVHGVQAFFENNFSANDNFADKDFNKIYAVGKKSKKALLKEGLGTFKVKKNALELSNFLIQNNENESYLHFCGNIALDTLDKNLKEEKIKYEKVVVYTTSLKYPVIKTVYDEVVFFSPSGVRSFMKNNSVEGKKIYSIGSTTTAEIMKHTKEKIFTSEESTLEDILHLIIKKL